MTDLTKPCIACCEPINVAARKCPHCHQIQSKAAAVQNHPLTSWIGLLLFAGVLLAMMIMLYNLMSRDEKPALLEISPSTLRISSPRGSPVASCFASIKNADTVVWSNPSLQAQFFDRSGGQIDVHYETHKVGVLPTRSSEARVSGAINAAREEYASCKISVLSAK
jgi:hypothetical protein